MPLPNDGRPAPEVLLVEDDANVLHASRDVLARAGFAVNVATTGWEALKAIKAVPIELIISEITLADMDGNSLREKCMLHPESRDVPFLFIVPSNQPDLQVRALRAGVDDVVLRPFDPVVLVARAQAVLARRQAYMEIMRVDPLTRLLNRHSFESELEVELGRARRYDREGALALLDVDALSRVNDESGSPLGDLLLTCLSGVVLSSIRNVDLAGRYRGEKLVLYLPETPPEGAEILVRRIQEHLRSISVSIGGHQLSVTAGIIPAPLESRHGAELITLALALARRSKQQGPGGVALLGREFHLEDIGETQGSAAV
jgi:diguanylate cyclase (GGDEF)-like protein